MQEYTKPLFLLTRYFKDVTHSQPTLYSGYASFYAHQVIIWSDSAQDPNPLVFISVEELIKELRSFGYKISKKQTESKPSD